MLFLAGALGIYLVAIAGALRLADAFQLKWSKAPWLAGGLVTVLLTAVFIGLPGYLNPVWGLADNVLKSIGAVCAAALPIGTALAVRTRLARNRMILPLLAGLGAVPLGLFAALYFSCMAGDCI